jgi:hypothetical protein
MFPEGSAFSRGPVSSTITLTLEYGPGHGVAGMATGSCCEKRTINVLSRMVCTQGVPLARSTRGSTCSGSAPAALGARASAIA